MSPLPSGAWVQPTIFDCSILPQSKAKVLRFIKTPPPTPMSLFSRVYLSVLVSALLIGISACDHDNPPPPPVNLEWIGKLEYSVPPSQTLALKFGINDEVDQLTNGNLPITVSQVLTNSGTEAIAAGYDITLNAVRWTFLAVSGQAGFLEGDPAIHTLFTCSQLGPELDPGEQVTISFTLSAPGCPINTPPATSATTIPCGMFQATMSADFTTQIPESNEQDNDAKDFFFVPSSILAINIATVRNPAADPNLIIIGKTVHAYAPGYSAATTVVTHNFSITSVPAGDTITVNAITPRNGALAGNIGNMSPGPFPQIVTPPGGGSVYNYNATIPDPFFQGPCNGIFAPLSGDPTSYLETINSKITAISSDGCAIAQKSALVTVVHECN